MTPTREGVVVAGRIGGAPTTLRTITAIALLSFLAALVAARVGGLSGPWLWNLDMPKVDFPLASLFHDALRMGRLPLWDDRLGLGFPLYAEGQIGAFYPPNWLIFRLPPLLALDVTRVFHLTLAGIGTGVLTLRLTGSRTGAAAAALTAVLSGAIATKLEWYNLVAAYAWLPWVLVPLVRRPHPTRVGIVIAGVLWGVQALAGHPNVWFLAGLVGSVVVLATLPRLISLARVAAFVGLGIAVGAVQLIPTAILTTLSVRSLALSRDDLFTSAATPFDILGYGFANPYVQSGGDGSWNLATTWYPDGSFALLEAAAFIGLPVIGLAAVGLTQRRLRPILVAIAVLLAIPIVAAFRPDPWAGIPVLNGLRSPVRSYIVVALLVGVLAGVGIGRLGRIGTNETLGTRARGFRGWGSATARATGAVSTLLLSYAAVLGLATLAPSTFDSLLLAASTFLGANDVEDRRRLAVAALTAPLPLIVEIALGGATVVAVATGQAVRGARRSLALIAVGLVAVPLVLFGHAPNPVRPRADFSSAGTDLVGAARSAHPHRLLTLNRPGFYPGMPDQLAIAGVPDIEMFSSLNLLASEQVFARLQRNDPIGTLRRTMGIDTVIAFGKPCPGRSIATVAEFQATLCRIDDALLPPYWIPESDVIFSQPADGSPIRPRDADLVDDAVLTDARTVAAVRRDPGGALVATIDAPTDGWLWIDRAWWPAWRVGVDGRDVATARALAGQLVPIPAGRHELREELVPWDAALGVGLGAIAVAAGLIWARPRGRDRGRYRPS